MSALTTELVRETEPLVETMLDALEPETDNEPKKQVWRRLEEIEDERRLRDELADWEDFTVEN